MLQKRWIVGSLCAALVLFAAALGLQQMRMNDLDEQIGSLKTTLQQEHAQLDDRIGSLEKDREALISSYSAKFAGMDLQKKTVQIHVEITTSQNIQNEYPDIVVTGNGDTGKYNWPEDPLSSGPDGTRYSATLDLPMDASNMELLLRMNRASEVLQTCSSIADLLPVQLISCGGDVLYNAERQIFYQTEWCAELSDLNVVSAAFHIYKNGKLMEESPCNLEPYENETGNILRCWDAADGHGTPSRPGDELEMRFLCTDEYGIGYEYIVGRWQVTDTAAAAHWLRKPQPNLVWPEEN